jgi:RNA polymerase sigma factor (sigma-70 family)
VIQCPFHNSSLIKENQISILTDLELVEQYKKTGKKIFIGEIYERYTRFVFLVSMKYLKDEEQAKDAAMQIFEKLFTDLKQHDVSNFKSWLYTVTKNHCLLSIRKGKAKAVYEEEVKKDHKTNMESPGFLYLENDKDDEAKLQELEKAVQGLSEEQRICIELFYLKEKSYDEITKITSYSNKKVKSYIQNGKRNLKNILLKNKNE